MSGSTMHQSAALLRYRSAPSSLLASCLEWDDPPPQLSCSSDKSETGGSSLELPSEHELFSLPDSPDNLWPPPLPNVFSDMAEECSTASMKGHLSNATEAPAPANSVPQKHGDFDMEAFALLESRLDVKMELDDVASSTSGVGWNYETFSFVRNQPQYPAPILRASSQNPVPILRASSLPAPARPRSAAGLGNATSPNLTPCQSRAKRGCATHPRSIAERVRRTRISEKMRKLQELVPNIGKQLSTAEMLDEAVDYVKYLQRQVKELSGSCGGCYVKSMRARAIAGKCKASEKDAAAQNYEANP